MTLLPWIIRTCFWFLWKFFQHLKKTNIQGYLRNFFYYILKMYVVCTHQNCLIEAILMSTLNIPFYYRRSKRHPYITSICLLPGTMIQPQWLELPISRKNFHGPKDVQTICTLIWLQVFTEEGKSSRCFQSQHVLYPGWWYLERNQVSSQAHAYKISGTVTRNDHIR